MALNPWKVATFNVNGVRARLPVLVDWLSSRRPDVVCLQEIKCLEESFPAEPFRELGYTLKVRGQKSFNGVAVLSLREPEVEVRGFEDGDADEEARLLAVRVDGVWVVNTYVPQGRDPLDPAFQYKLGFLSRLKRWMDGRFLRSMPVIWTGDINVAPEPLDVFDPERLEGEVGFHPDERAALKDAMSWGFVDLFRRLHPHRRQFTFWDYRMRGGLSRNLGWRIDHVLVTEPLWPACLECDVDMEPRAASKPSDHTPVWASFDLSRLT
ncbi:MAG: exodeoxyribonuclease III [Syntrophobacteraceae bacterium]|jgi:exodeoxyribonuclease-3|nr:exodeoxyribonuclease III [Syntrophobacteraceae bacterium]